MSWIKRAVAAWVATMAMAACAQSASATYYTTVSPLVGMSSRASALTFSDSSGLFRIACPVTLSGVFLDGPIPVADGASLGLASMEAGTCSGGTIDLTGGFTMYVHAAVGTLPNSATALDIHFTPVWIHARTTILGIPVACLYIGTLDVRRAWSGSNPYMGGAVTVQTTPTVPLNNGHAVCPSTARVSGTFSASSTTHTFTVR